jgi:hypothetical protein
LKLTRDRQLALLAALLLWAIFAACLLFLPDQAPAQNTQTFAQKLYYASDYGVWNIPGQYPNTYLFSPPGQCLIPVPAPGDGSYVPFNTNAPLWIRDAVVGNSELVTPASIVANASFCGVSVTTAHQHVSFSLQSGTGGLQEVLNQISSTIPYAVQVILDRNWYSLVAAQGQTPATVIGAIHGSTAAVLTDVTTAPATSYQWNGSVYVAQGGSASSVDYNQGSTGAVTRTSTNKWQDSISLLDFDADPGNLSADSDALHNAVAAATASGKSVFVPAGTYNLSNSFGPALTGANNVLIWGEGPASQFVCNTVGTYDCIQSTGATGFGLQNLSISFGPSATTRSSGYAVDIETCTNCLLDGVNLNNGDLSGLRVASSVHTSIHNLKVSNFYANGTFLINNQDLRLDGLACQNNQDACFETSWFDSEYSAHSIPCEQITATNITSSNDLEGVLVNACRNVTVNGFSIVGSAKESVFVGQDPSTTTLHWPDRVAIANGAIYGAGYGTNPLNVATAPAFYINVGTNPGAVVSHLALSNITATHISNWGLQMAELQNDDVNMSNVQFYDVGNGNSTGCLLTEGNNVNLDSISCTDVGTYGLYDTNTNRLTGTGLQFSAVSQISGIDAIYLATTATGFVNLTNVGVNDTNVSSFSGQVYDASTTGQHALWNISITYATATGYLGPTAANPGTSYTYTDPGHALVYRNGGMIQSFVPPNYYFLPTAGATSTQYVNGAVLYYQSKCWSGGAQQTESVGWLDQYPTLSTESFSFNQFGGCGFPITIDMTQAASVLEPQTTVTGTVSGKHLGGMASGTYASVPSFAAGAGAGTSPTLAANANSNDVSGYLTVTTGSSPTASATVATGTFGTAYATLAKCSLWPANAAAAALTGTAAAYVPVGSQTAFTIAVGSTALAASTLYIWGYACTQ